MVYITPLVINVFGGGHTHTHANVQFQKTKHTEACGPSMPGLKVMLHV